MKILSTKTECVERDVERQDMLFCFFFLIEVSLTENIISASGVQHNDSIFVYIEK